MSLEKNWVVRIKYVGTQRISMSPAGQFVSVLDRVISFFEGMGQPEERDTRRNGFMSYAGETHAAGMGIAAGFILTATGDTKLLSVVYGAAVYGRANQRNGKRRAIVNDIRDEWHYALGGIVFGAVLGAIVSLVPPIVP